MHVWGPHLENHCSKYPENRGKKYYACNKEPRRIFKEVTNVMKIMFQSVFGRWFLDDI